MRLPRCVVKKPAHRHQQAEQGEGHEDSVEPGEEGDSDHLGEEDQRYDPHSPPGPALAAAVAGGGDEQGEGGHAQHPGAQAHEPADDVLDHCGVAGEPGPAAVGVGAGDAGDEVDIVDAVVEKEQPHDEQEHPGMFLQRLHHPSRLTVI